MSSSWTAGLVCVTGYFQWPQCDCTVCLCVCLVCLDWNGRMCHQWFLENVRTCLWVIWCSLLSVCLCMCHRRYVHKKFTVISKQTVSLWAVYIANKNKYNSNIYVYMQPCMFWLTQTWIMTWFHDFVSLISFLKTLTLQYLRKFILNIQVFRNDLEYVCFSLWPKMSVFSFVHASLRKHWNQ